MNARPSLLFHQFLPYPPSIPVSPWALADLFCHCRLLHLQLLSHLLLQLDRHHLLFHPLLEALYIPLNPVPPWALADLFCHCLLLHLQLLSHRLLQLDRHHLLFHLLLSLPLKRRHLSPLLVRLFLLCHLFPENQLAQLSQEIQECQVHHHIVLPA